MDLMNERKYKDDLPINTINKIRNILNDLGILTVEKGWLNSAKGYYSVTVSIANTTLSTNGKGTSYEYALASAYGELMERIQNQAPFRLNTDLSQEDNEYKGFFYSPDEKEMSIKEIIDDDNEWIHDKFLKVNRKEDIIKLLKKWQEISYEKINSDFIGLPFCNLNSGKVSYIPIKMLSKMYMSNGMCAGNTPEEALVQGISEIFERNVNKKIIKEKITPPSIPSEYLKKFPKLEDMINQIEMNGNYKVILKDCSLDLNFPVVGVVYINKDDQTYFVKFGSHPSYEMAVERTLTELLQGQDIKKMRGVWKYSYQSDYSDNHNNLLNILVNGCGCYPNEFFSAKESYEFKPFVDVSKMNNKEVFKYLIDMLKEKGYNVYVRDASYLGFPAFHVIIPNLSEIEEINDYNEIQDYAELVKAKKLIRNITQPNEYGYLQLAKFLDEKNFGLEVSVMQFLNLPINSSLPWYYSNMDLFVVALYCHEREYSKAYSVLNKYLKEIQANSSDSQLLSYYCCIRDYLAAKTMDLSDKELIDALSTFYHINMINGIIDEMGDCENIFIKHGYIKCFNCQDCLFKNGCLFKETERIYKILKERYALSKIKQEELKHLID